MDRGRSKLGGSPLYGTDFLQILERNLGAALVLYSGIVTLGLTTLVGSGILALYVGATMSLGMHSSGVSNLLGDVIWYVPFEFLGLVLAATAGFQPVTGLVGRMLLKNEPASVSSFINDIALSLRTLLLALALIVVGAAIEASLILLKT